MNLKVGKNWQCTLSTVTAFTLIGKLNLVSKARNTEVNDLCIICHSMESISHDTHIEIAFSYHFERGKERQPKKKDKQKKDNR